MVLRFLLLLFLFWHNHNANGSVVKDYSTNNEYSWFDYNHKLRQAVTPTDTLLFAYDALGNRNLKPKENKDSLFYVNDLQGNIMATYKLKNDSLYLVDQPLYGSSRLGTETMSRLLWQRDTNVYYSNALYSTVRGNKQYEISNHLGNVLATVSDKKVGVDTTADNLYDYYEPVEITATDYYAYGGELPERTYTDNIGEYIFGYQGSLRDDKIGGKGVTYYTLYRILNTNAITWNSIDPKKHLTPWESPYVSMGNNPIWRIDPLGDSEYKVTKKGHVKLTKKTDDKFHTIFNSKKDDKITVGLDFFNDYKYSRTFNNKTKETLKESTVLKSQNDEEYKKAFKFFADNSDVEWNLSVFEDKGIKQAVLSTTHSEGAVKSHGLFINSTLDKSKTAKLLSNVHSHPSPYDPKDGHPAYPSGFESDLSVSYRYTGDRDQYESLIKNKNYKGRIPSKFSIYVPSAPLLKVEYDQLKVTRYQNTPKK